MGQVKPWLAKSLAKTIESQPFMNVIAFKDETEKEMKIDLLGRPESYGPWVLLANDAASAVAAEGEQDKEKFLEKIWWEEETQTLVRTRDYLKTSRQVYQTRTVNEEDRLVLYNTITKPDGTSNTFKAIFKRKQVD